METIQQQESKKEIARRELSRRHLADFCEYVYEGYLRSWHTNILCEALEYVEKGELRFLIVEMPPRHSKSLHVSQLFPAWVVGRDKDTPIIVSSYSGDLAWDHGRETRNLIDSNEYQNIFETRLAEDSKAKGKWNTNGRGAYNAAGVGGSITGKGAKIFIIDDPFKDRKEAESLLIRDDRYSWMRSVARTRLTPDGAMVVMHTRWHDDDLIGRIVAENDWVDYFSWREGDRSKKWARLTLPAIAEEDELYRKEGEALWADRYSLTELESIKKDLGGYEWSALYQQSPVDDEHRVFHPEWFKYRTLEEVMSKNPTAFMTIDPKASNDKDGGSDYIGVTINFMEPNGVWNLMSYRVRFSTKDLIDFLFTSHLNFKLAKIGIEKTAYTEGYKVYLDEQMLLRNHYLPIVELKHGGTSKHLRIESLQPRYERGGVYHIKQNEKNMCADLEEELLKFPKAKNDDSSDSAAYQNQIIEAVDVSKEDDASLTIH